MLLVGVAIAWGVILRIKTANGTIELVNLPMDAEVLVDGEEVAVTLPGGGKPALISVNAGKHKIVVERDGIEISGDQVTVQAERKETFNVRVIASTKSPREFPKDIAQKTIKNSIGMTFKLIPAGEFLMGSDATDPEAEDAEFLDKAAGKQERHRVRITRPFYLGVTEVTRGQFRRFVHDAGYQTEAEKDGKGAYGWNDETKMFEQIPKYTWQNPGYEQTDEHPVVIVSWNDAQAFVEWLSQKEGQTYRLPTEAEWEYACRAGTTTRYASGDELEVLASAGNTADETAKEKFPDWNWAIASRDGYIYTAPVGRFGPNAFGLFDMEGNVWELCSDGYSADYYKQSPIDDPSGAVGASVRVIRGGGWYDSPRYRRSAARRCVATRDRGYGLGFRLALGQPVR